MLDVDARDEVFSKWQDRKEDDSEDNSDNFVRRKTFVPLCCRKKSYVRADSYGVR
jgi:hypothetical protein